MPHISDQDTSQFPPMVVVSVGNTCNYACAHCFYPHYVRQPYYIRHDMEFALFKKIANEMANHPASVLRLIAWGEPLLHPQLQTFVSYMHKVAPHNKITLITNGSLLSANRSLGLMRAGLDMVEVSIDAATEQTYGRRRANNIRDAFRRVQSNVRAIIEQRDRHNYQTKVVVSYIIWPEPESEQEFALFKDAWRSTVDEIIQRPLHSFKGTLQIQRKLPVVRTPCYGLWARCDITPWGEITVCYNDWERTNVIGDLNDSQESIERIWRGQALRGLQAAQMQGEFSGICANCEDYNPSAWTHPYEQVITRCFDNGSSQ